MKVAGEKIWLTGCVVVCHGGIDAAFIGFVVLGEIVVHSLKISSRQTQTLLTMLINVNLK